LIRRNRLSGSERSRYAIDGERFGAAPGFQRKTRRLPCRPPF
jgi:hypothetical protein